MLSAFWTSPACSVCIVFQAERCYGECACFTYCTVKVDKDAEGARLLPALLFHLLVTTRDVTQMLFLEPWQLANRPGHSMFDTRRRMATKNGMMCVGMCVKLYTSNGRRILLYYVDLRGMKTSC